MPLSFLFSTFVIPTLLSIFTIFHSFFMYNTVHKNIITKTHKKVLISTSQPHTPQTTGSDSILAKSHGDQVHDAKEITNKENLTTTSDATANAQSSGMPITPVLSQSVSPSHIITASTAISLSGKTIQLTMQYPSLGGSFSGTISGDCSGTLSGNYDGPSMQTISGKGNASCQTGFLTIPVGITYSGKLLSQSSAQITYTASALGNAETGSTTLSLSQ